MKKTVLFDKIEYSNELFNTWVEVVDYIATYFINEGYASKTYFEKIKHEMIEHKSYMVIAPGIVLLHSSTDESIKDNAFHFMKLENPVEFMHKTNDPVDLVLTFCAVDIDKHMEIIKEIAELLMDDSIITKLRSSKSTHELEIILNNLDD